MSSKRRSKSAAPISPKPDADASSPNKKLKSELNGDGTPISHSPAKLGSQSTKVKAELSGDEDYDSARFVEPRIPDSEARERWPLRYRGKKKQQVVGEKNSRDDAEEVIQAHRHYSQAEVDNTIYNLFDDAHVKAEDGEEDYICRIVEMFEAVDGQLYFTAQWYYRAKDTVVKDHAHLINDKRVFFSEVRDDNPLDCLVKKLNIARIPLSMAMDKKKTRLPACDFYCDMLYLLPYSSFVKLPESEKRVGSETSSTISSEGDTNGPCEVTSIGDVTQAQQCCKPDVALLDLYSGCGAMSTGLCLGGNLSGVNLVTKWAVDLNQYACESLKFNHPETEVRNEMAEDFLSLLKEWEVLCKYFSLIKSEGPQQKYVDLFANEEEEEDEGEDEKTEDDEEVFEVEKILAICYGDPNGTKKRGLFLKVSWKGYGSDEDTWEPIEGLSNCKEKLKDFVTNGYKSKSLPLPGDVDVICGGPPCQGISGFNRFRNIENPLEDEKNKQLVVFMDLVEYLRPKYVLMENVVDIVRFANGYLGRYALGRLISMNYQVRMGMIAAGAYGLPQFRRRMFMWGAQPTEKLPQYPLPTHDVVVRGGVPTEFEMNAVAFDDGHNGVELEKKLLLEDAISDLPAVGNDERRDEMPYDKPPLTEFQRLIRLPREERFDCSTKSKPAMHELYDHRPLELNTDDYQRVCQIPKRKGANFRDLPGVRVRPDNKVEWDPDIQRVYLKSGKPLVPDYAMTFVKGSSPKPFGRLWWDETVPTVVTRAEPHNQAILHPEQERVLTIRENARLQGFPDYYKLFGPVKERYIQVGNAVAVPVARALGYSLGMAFQGLAADEPVFSLPKKLPNIVKQQSFASSEEVA
ncbi:DNA (cytosine-5)-methyltransferase CMT3-like isoform X1 [Cucurbita pepo subsp. pepo]|uniref:DNA (cytosine-5)-methyltransferase CMT3-like isoform X1 n=2 Tax=Cucurbita pepo subsp. pepo TaxID=3664 RepID=UPI000C9D5373|nr:DNA (cytosine-5)-methyltransferase CMT3-like isoform X1 [Cucurbita pepo subsp. pepo]